MAKQWTSLTTPEQINQLDVWDDAALAKQFDREPLFFAETRNYFQQLPKTIKEPKPILHFPPKELIVSARRDLSFFEANYELFDNSIDKWRLGGAKRDLTIRLNYNLDLNNGHYVDDAGGMAEEDVYKVFIPGETTNDDFGKPVIGSFGMGAKKGIFRLTEGAKVVSCTSKMFSSTSEVPEGWENIPNWETLDGRAEATKIGTTQIYLFKLFDPPTDADIDDLIKRTGTVYRPLLDGSLLGKKVHMIINETAVRPASQPSWSGPSGAEPRIYTFSHVFENFLNTGNDIKLSFRLKCGLSRRLPGGSNEADADWGVDVYGNGRLIDRFLKKEFGFGTTGMSTGTAGNKYFRAELIIDGNSFAIPWDTHKREYLGDHIVSQWLRTRVRPLAKAYAAVANNFSSAKATELRNKYLAATKPSTRIKSYDIDNYDPPPASVLPKWTYGPLPGGKRKPRAKSPTDGNGSNNETDVNINVTLEKSDFDSLLQRFDVEDEEELADTIADCLINGVVFSLSGDELRAALSTFDCASAAELSGEVKQQLVKKLKVKS